LLAGFVNELPYSQMVKISDSLSRGSNLGYLSIFQEKKHVSGNEKKPAGITTFRSSFGTGK
jgi:hypothetical protein